MSLLPLEDAQGRLISAAEPLPGELLPAENAVGRFLAEPLLARRTQPAADLSAMDGYAMRSDDLAGPWQVVGESAAGHPFAGELQAGQAIRISTGAFMPSGNGAVLLQENATRTGDTLSLNGEGDPDPRHIRRRGFDFSERQELLGAGQRVGPAQLALAISGGHGQLSVHALPSVAILDSGDELASDPANCAAHQIPPSNGAMLAAMAQPFASSITRLGPVPDRMDAMLDALRRASDADVIVTSGGASVGDHDLVRPALEQWGAAIDFWKVAIRPGKPLLIARKGPQWIVGLPGNPVSSYVTGFLFLLPLLRRLAGSRDPLPRAVDLVSGTALPENGHRATFLRARLEGGRAVPLNEQDSSGLMAMAHADALIYRPSDDASVEQGSQVPVYLLQNGGIA